MALKGLFSAYRKAKRGVRRYRTAGRAMRRLKKAEDRALGAGASFGADFERFSARRKKFTSYRRKRRAGAAAVAGAGFLGLAAYRKRRRRRKRQ